jgi:hypothetical protein
LSAAKKIASWTSAIFLRLFRIRRQILTCLDKLYAQLAEEEIEIVPATEPTPESLSDEWVAEDEEEVVVARHQLY